MRWFEPFVYIFVLALSLWGCATANPIPNGDGGAGDTGGTGGTGGMPAPSCGQDSLEENDMVDESTGIASGTVNGTCQVVGGEVDCEGPDLLDEWFLTANQEGAHTIALSWSNATSDLNLAVLELPPACEVLEVSTSSAGTEETINVFLQDGTEVIIAVLAFDTNNSTEAYEVSVDDGTGGTAP